MSKVSNDVVIKALALLRSLNKEYGSEKAMEVWAGMSNLIDDGDLTLEVFKCLMNGGFKAQSFRLVYWDASKKNKVAAIKAIRFWSGLGLKDAKKMVDAAEIGEENIIELKKVFDDNGNQMEIDYDNFNHAMKQEGLVVELA